MTIGWRAAIVAFGALLLSGCAGYVRDRIYQPVPIADTPVTFDGEAPQEITATTADGLELHGYYWPAAPGDDTLLVSFHGNGYNQLVGALRAEPFHTGGHGVLVASYRGYGGNPGSPSEEGLFADGEAWMAKARALAPDAKLYLFGHSLGGAVALEMAAQHEVAGVATLGAFTKLAEVAPSIARGVLPDHFDNLAAIGQVTEPLYLYHGTEDETVPYASAAELKGAGGANVTVVPLEGGHHHVPMEKLAPLVWHNFGYGN